MEATKEFLDHNPSQLDETPSVVSKMKNLLEDVRVYWYNLEQFRYDRKRGRNFYLGDQWSDLVEDPDDKTDNPGVVPESEIIRRRGRVPMINNQMRQLGKHLIGQYRQNDTKPQVYPTKNEESSTADMMTSALHSVYRDNELEELDARAWEEFIISGFVGWKSYVDWVPEKDMEDCQVDLPQAGRTFWNTDVADPRMKDLRIIGELHDVTINEVIAMFAKNDEDADLIRKWYDGYGDNQRADWTGLLSKDIIDHLDFYWTNDSEKCRVYEIWKRELVDKTMVHDHGTGEIYQTDLTAEEARAFYQERVDAAVAQGIPAEMVPPIEITIKPELCWYYYFITPNGEVLAKGESVYEHQSHPYTVRLYPLIDSQIRGLMTDVIDQQKQINKLVTLMDFMVGAGAKGVLMIPEDMVPSHLTPEEFADEWTRWDGMIIYKPSKDHQRMPQQITANSQNAGAADLLSIQLKFFQEISGVNDAMQGRAPTSGTPAALYAIQSDNASISNKDAFEFFSNARKNRDLKIVKLIQQFYDEPRWINVAGNDNSARQMLYDPMKVKDVSYNLVVDTGANTATYRQVMDEWLMKLLELGQIGVQDVLEHSHLPFKDKLLESIKSKQNDLDTLAESGEIPNEYTQQLIKAQQ
jgi:hypothetical protein